MKVVALISGGKDSLLSAILCHQFGHSIEALAHIRSANEDSMMYQSAGSELIEMQAQSMQLPLFVQESKGIAVNQQLDYFFDSQIAEKTKQQTGLIDEIEDLYELLTRVKQQNPQINAVCSGAVKSDYQRKRIENVCSRLGLSSLSFLWNQNQFCILQQVIDQQMNAILVKVATLGLNKSHLGVRISNEFVENVLKPLYEKYKINVAGEGGEFESLVLDCPYFSKTINIKNSEIVGSFETAYLKINEAELVDKSEPFQSLRRESLQTQVLPQVQVEDPSHVIQPALRQKIQISEGGDWFFVDQISASNFLNEPKEFQGIEQEVRFVFDNLQELLQKQGKSLKQIYYVNLYISNMSLYGIINKVYNSYFNFPNPPARICVELKLPSQLNSAFYMQCNGYLVPSKKKVIHVQSFSQWAPANIGPYSQCQTIQGRVFLAGSIPFIPHTMTLADNQTCVERTCLNIQKVMEEAQAKDLDYCIMFYSEKFLTNAEQLQASIAQIRQIFNDQKLIIPCVSNPMIPKAAQIELCVGGKLQSFDKQFFQEAKGEFSVQGHYTNTFYDYTIYFENFGVNLDQFLDYAHNTILKINKNVTQKSPVTNEQLLTE